MSKRKLTDKQARQITEIHDTRTEQARETGLLTTRFGANATVVNDTWEPIHCNMRQNLPELAPGDRVAFEMDKQGHGVITAVLPRQTLLNRPDSRGKSKPLAANVTQMIITIASLPRPSTKLIDSYLVAAANIGLKAIILANKCDLMQSAGLQDILSIYQQLDYLIIETSAEIQTNIEQLQNALQHETSIFVGQSGVGKSSLINTLLPDCNTRVGEISESKNHGKHTTTRTQVFNIPTGGYLIDSPGVRQFRLWHSTPAEILRGYPEIAQFAKECQFRDCSHAHEPGCAVKTAIENGYIHPSRWQSFVELRFS